MADKDATRNPVLQSVFFSLFEILGPDKAGDLFKSQGIDPRDLCGSDYQVPVTTVIERIGKDLENEFGELAARGLLIRAGRASLIFFRRFFPEVAELGSLPNRLKPVDRRFLHSLESLAGLWSRKIMYPAGVERVDRGEYRWTLSSKINEKNQALTPFYLFGLLEEFCSWLDARKSYQIVYSEPVRDRKAEISITVKPQE
jgi:hypothetical protein